MTFDKWALKDFLTIGEVAQRLSKKAGEKVERADVLSYALHGYLPLALDIATNTRDVEGRPLERGVWDLVMEGEQGKNAKRQVEHDHRLLVNRANKMDLKGLQGAWVARGDDRRQLDSRWGDWWESPEAQDLAYPRGTMLVVRREALDAFLAKKEASSKTPIRADWKDVTITFTSESQVQVHVGANPSHVQTYGDLGFEDQKRKQGTMAWELFLKLAEAKPQRIDLPPKKKKTRWKDGSTKDGTIEEVWKDETGDTERRQIQNRKDEINSALRTAFERLGYEIPTKPEPIQFDKRNDCYEPNFHIKLSSSY